MGFFFSLALLQKCSYNGVAWNIPIITGLLYHISLLNFKKAIIILCKTCVFCIADTLNNKSYES